MRSNAMLKTIFTLMLAVGTGVCAPAQAHFQLVYTPEVLPEKSGDLPLKLVFWHPFENGPVMDMGAPEAFFALHRGARIDLMDSLTPTRFDGAQNSAAAYDAVLPVRRAGDYVLALQPAPYFEQSEDKYIQQFAKSYVNRAGLPTDWEAEVGMAAEIIPLSKPYNVIAGSSFTGRVMADGKPVAGAEIEVEYIAALPDMETSKAGVPSVGPMPGGAVVIRSDDNGLFTYAVPRAGHWGFAALDIGPDKMHGGKDLSQDAVIWIRAFGLE